MLIALHELNYLTGNKPLTAEDADAHDLSLTPRINGITGSWCGEHRKSSWNVSFWVFLPYNINGIELILRLVLSFVPCWFLLLYFAFATHGLPPNCIHTYTYATFYESNANIYCTSPRRLNLNITGSLEAGLFRILTLNWNSQLCQVLRDLIWFITSD